MTTDLQTVIAEAEGMAGAADTPPRKTAVATLLGELEPPIDLAGFDLVGPVAYDERRKRMDAAFQAILAMGIEAQFSALSAELQRHGYWTEVGVSADGISLGMVPVRGTAPKYGRVGEGVALNVDIYSIGVTASNAAGDVFVAIDGADFIEVPWKKISPQLVLAGFKDFLRQAIKNAKKGKK
jgi:hypothetical protein